MLLETVIGNEKLRIRRERVLSSWRGALIGLKHFTIEQLIAIQVS